MRKRLLLSALICVNAALLLAIVFSTTSPRHALAQNTGLAGQYLVVAGEVQDQFDGLYLLDVQTRVLHAFYYDRASKSLRYADARDLDRDFRNNEEQP